MKQTHNLYRHFDKQGKLLYIGISNSAFIRLQTHLGASSWADEIVSMTIELCADRQDALEKEQKAIITEQPFYNKVHSTKVINPTSIWGALRRAENGGIQPITLCSWEGSTYIREEPTEGNFTYQLCR